MKLHRCIFLCVLALLASPLWADVTGSISGYVRDTSGAALPGAHVVVLNLATGFSKQASADPQGQFTFLALPPGRYRLSGDARGFSSTTIDNIDLNVNDQLRIDLTLRIGSVKQEISVQANPVQVQTESTQIGNTIESRQMLAMPLNGRSFLDLLSLQAGVAPETSGKVPNDRTVSGLFTNAGNVSVDGQPETANAFLINGIDVSETKNMGAGVIPNLDSIQEFRLITNSFDAEYGKFTGAVTNTITRSGANALHGDAFEFLRNRNLDARNYFDNARADLHRNQFGYAVGGPFWKDHLFWFTDYQGTRQSEGASTGLIQVPTAAQRSGAFSASAFSGSSGPTTVDGSYFASILTQRLGYTVSSGEPYSTPACTTTTQCVFPAGIIPQQAFDPVAVNEMKYIPVANINPASGLFESASTANTVTDHNMGQRVDFNNHRTGDWSFYYHFDDSTAFNALAGQSGAGGPPLPGFPGLQPSRNQLFMVSNTRTLGSSAVNVARIGFFRTAVSTAEPQSSTAISLSSLGFTTGQGTLGIVPSGPAGYPQSLPPDDFNNFSVGNDWLNMFQADNNYMVSDIASKSTGNHTVSFGGEYRYYQLNVRNVCGPNGYFTFNGSETGSDIADYLLGAPAQFVQCSEQLLNNRARYGGLFGQDSWKFRPNLTVNAGLRWEVATPWSDTDGMLSTARPGVQSVIFPTAPLGYLVPGDPGVPSTISPIQWNTVAPRLGIAWAPSFGDNFLGKLFGPSGASSVRAAWGIYYLGAGDLGNFGVIGDAPWGLYWQSSAPPTLDQPYLTRSDGVSQGQRFPFTFPTGKGPHTGFDFSQYLPLVGPGYSTTSKLTYAEHYNLSLQRQLSPSTVLTLTYVGTQSHKLQLDRNIILGSSSLCEQLAAAGATPKCGPNKESTIFTLPGGGQVYGTMLGALDNQALGTVYNQVAFGGIHLLDNIGKSNYNALQVTVERRAADLSLLAAYTYSKSLDNVSNTLNVRDPRSTYSISPFDLKHNFVVSYSWALPFQRAFSAAPRRLASGWNLSGITRFAGGFPVSLRQSGDIALTGRSIDFPNVVGPVVKQNPRKAGPTGPNQYFLPGAFASEQLGIIGNARPRFFYGPGIINTDAGLMKDTQLTESTSVQLRAEFFNVFNHANFTSPVGNFSSSQFGQSTDTLPGRIGQVSAKFIW